MKYEIQQQLAQQLLNYLQTRPYGEVFQLIDGIRTLTPITQDNQGVEVVDEEEKSEEGGE